MAAESVSERELTALHRRISRDVVELRTRWRGWSLGGRRSPDEFVGVVLQAVRVIRAIQDVAANARFVDRDK